MKVALIKVTTTVKHSKKSGCLSSKILGIKMDGLVWKTEIKKGLVAFGVLLNSVALLD